MSTSLRKGSSDSSFSPSRMVYCCLRLHLLVGLVEGLDGLLEDGLHPRSPLLPEALWRRCTTESAVRSRSAKTRVSSRLMPGERVSSDRSISRTLADERTRGRAPSMPATRSVWGSMTTMASGSLPSAFSRSLWVTRWCMRVDLPMRVRAT